MVKSSTKYAVMIKDPNSIKYHLEKAYFLSTDKTRSSLDRYTCQYSKCKINPGKLKGFIKKKKKFSKIKIK
jgi:hypothetical protein